MLDLISACPFSLSISWGWMRGGNVQRDWILLTPQSSPHLWRHSYNSHLVEAGMFWGKMWKSKNQTGRRMWPAAINQKVQVGGHVYKIDWKLARWIELLRSGTNHYTFSHCNRPLLPVLLSTKKKKHPAERKPAKLGANLHWQSHSILVFMDTTDIDIQKYLFKLALLRWRGFTCPDRWLGLFRNGNVFEDTRSS